MAACFSLQWLEQLLIWFLIVCFIVAVIKLLVPAILSWFGGPPGADTVMTILWWLVGLIVAIYFVILVFDLLACLSGSGGLGLPRLR